MDDPMQQARTTRTVTQIVGLLMAGVTHGKGGRRTKVTRFHAVNGLFLFLIEETTSTSLGHQYNIEVHFGGRWPCKSWSYLD